MKTFKSILILLLLAVTGTAQNLYFPPVTGNDWDTISPQRLHWCQEKIDSLYNYLDSNNTKAFILLKDGKIVLERYFGTHTQSTSWYWASAGKSLTAFLVGIARQEHFLEISDTTSAYLGPGWTACTMAQENKITVRNQLTMTSGLDDGVPDPYCTLSNCLVFKADAGSRWAYHNAPYTLLDGVMEAATGSTLNNYLALKLKTPTGMTGSYIKVDYNNLFFSTARSMARFGLLILNRGAWNGNKVMTDTAYFNQMTNTSQSLNRSYGYLWWLNGKATFMVPQSQIVFPGPLSPNAPSDMIAAMGKNGQFLNVVPSQNLVWLRMGDAPDGSDVPFLLNDQIWSYLNKLECTASSPGNNSLPDLKIRILRQQEQSGIDLVSDRIIRKVEVTDLYGRMVSIVNCRNNRVSILFDQKIHGLVIARVQFADGTILSRKVVI
jgi:CubicO group peptidase (beta-lactamase class C family)